MNASVIDAISATENIQRKEPILIEADQLSYDQALDTTVAKGNVVLVHGKETVIADELIYAKKSSRVYATGHIAILKDNGDVYFADRVDFDNVLYSGRILNFKARTQNNTLITAASADAKDKDTILLHNLRYSTCKVCASNIFPNVPMWEIRAKEALLDRKSEVIKYKHARLELFGVPVIYTPYLSTPSVNAKRKSGFLPPTFKWSNILGNSVQIPYYINIAPNMDAKVSTRVYTSADPLFEVGFRHLLESGEYEIGGSVTRSHKIDEKGKKLKDHKTTLGYLNVRSLFKIQHSDSQTLLGIEGERIKDPTKTYLKKYSISNQDMLTTDIFVNHVNKQQTDYVLLDTIHFQGLRPHDKPSTTPRVLPWIRTRYTKDLVGGSNGLINLDCDLLDLRRNEGNSYKRASSTLSHFASFVLRSGKVVTIKSSLRGDIYQSTQLRTRDNLGIHQRYYRKADSSRLYPSISLEAKWPLFKNMGGGTFIIEPVTNITIAGNQKVSSSVNNEDSQFFELSAYNLFDTNKFLGLDRLETGSKVSYGLKGMYSGGKISAMGITVGQVYNFQRHPEYGYRSGLSGRSSNYVIGIDLQYQDYLYFSNKLRLDQNALTILRHDVYGTLALEKWAVNVNYTQLHKRLLQSTDKVYNRDIVASISRNIYDKWWFGVGTQRKLGKKIEGQSKTISDGFHLNYLGDCLHLLFTVKKDYTKLKDLKPSTTYAVNFKIPGF